MTYDTYTLNRATTRMASAHPCITIIDPITLTYYTNDAYYLNRAKPRRANSAPLCQAQAT
jgi:hypothetical protein